MQFVKTKSTQTCTKYFFLFCACCTKARGQKTSRKGGKEDKKDHGIIR